eukprot:gene10720-11868_t
MRYPHALWILISLLTLQDNAAVAVCGGNYGGTLKGNISTPNYPQNYLDGSDCIWIINCPYGHVVSVNLVRINIEADKTCAFDYLVFHDGSSQQSTELSAQGQPASLNQKKVCGDHSNMRWISTGPSITVHFHSDDSTSAKGFYGSWQCVGAPATTTTTKTTPPRTANTASETRTNTHHSPKTTQSTSTYHYISTVRPVVTVKGTTITTRDSKPITARTPEKSSGIHTTVLTPKTVFCAAESYKNLFWTKTVAGTKSKQPCPTGASGMATRECFLAKDGSSKWSSFIDTSGCVSTPLAQIDNAINDPAVLSIASVNDLTVISKGTLIAGDVMKITQQLKRLVEKAKKIDLKNTNKQKSLQLHTGFMNIGNNLLDSSAWNQLAEKQRVKTATDLLKNLEDIALAVIQAQSESQTESVKSINSVNSNIVSSSKVIVVDESGSVSLLSKDLKRNATLQNTYWKLLGQVELPRKTIKDVADGDSKCYSVYIVARNAGKLLSGQQINKVNKPVATKAGFVNTFVTALAISPKPKRNFPEPVVIYGNLMVKVDLKKSHSKCSYLDTNSSSPSWSHIGVETVSVKEDQTVCHTNHFTNFAVLMRPNGGKMSAHHEFVLMIITQIGIGVSLLCLILALSIFVNCKSLQSVRNTIHKNLCVSLALAYVVFVVGISRTENQIVCTVFAIFLYYFLLVAFLWMLMEGIQLYILLVQIFPRGDGFKKQYYAICWGFPAVLSVVLCGSHPHGFGNASFCWLSTKDNFIWAFVVPVLIVIMVNSVFLVVTFRTILRNSSIIAREQEMRRTMDKIGYWAKGSVGLVPLLGITWLFGVLYINQESVAMAYLFTFCNAFQGVYIFIFYCIMNEKVREDFRRRFCAISRSSSHSFTAASKKSIRGSSKISLTAINFPWNQRRGTQTVNDVIVVHDPTGVRNGSVTTATTANVDNSYSKRYQDIIRDDTSVPEDTIALSSIERRGKESYRSSIQSTKSKDSNSVLISPDITRPSDIYNSDDEISHGSLVKTQLDGGNEEELSHLPSSTDSVRCEPEHSKCKEMHRDAADEFEEKVMRAIEMNIRRTLSEEDVAIDMYDDQTVYV